MTSHQFFIYLRSRCDQLSEARESSSSKSLLCRLARAHENTSSRWIWLAHLERRLAGWLDHPPPNHLHVHNTKALQVPSWTCLNKVPANHIVDSSGYAAHLTPSIPIVIITLYSIEVVTKGI